MSERRTAAEDVVLMRAFRYVAARKEDGGPTSAVLKHSVSDRDPPVAVDLAVHARRVQLNYLLF